MEVARIILAIHHEILCDGIHTIISEKPGYTVVDSTTTWEKLFELLQNNKADILILDLDIPDLDIPKALKFIKENNSDIELLSLSGPRDSNDIKNILALHGSGFIFKRRGKDELIKAIEIIDRGGNYLCEDTLRILIDDKPNKYRDISDITQRETQILKLICEENTNQEISDMLHISIRTVDAHRRNLLQKTGAKNTAGLVGYAVKNNIFNP